MKHTNSYINTQ